MKSYIGLYTFTFYLNFGVEENRIIALDDGISLKPCENELQYYAI